MKRGRLLKLGVLHIAIINQTSREKSVCLQVAHKMVPIVEHVKTQREKGKTSPPGFKTRPYCLISTLPSLCVSLSTCPSISIPAYTSARLCSGGEIPVWPLRFAGGTQKACNVGLRISLGEECPSLVLSLFAAFCPAPPDTEGCDC